MIIMLTQNFSNLIPDILQFNYTKVFITKQLQKINQQRTLNKTIASEFFNQGTARHGRDGDGWSDTLTLMVHHYFLTAYCGLACGLYSNPLTEMVVNYPLDVLILNTDKYEKTTREIIS
ncbi:hypothetical protein B1R44_07110 [Serratia marcescens]|nr:hypothetical protein B1R44_07110 [Serratia marcescens]